MEESKITGIIDRIRDRRTETRRRVLFVLLAVVAVAASADSIYIRYSDNLRADEKAAAAEAERAALASEREALKAEIKGLEETRLLAEKLPIVDLSVKNVGWEITISGKVRNTSSLEVGDIELTIYMVDSYLRPVYEERFTISSTDGLPLMKHQRRPFKIKLDPVPGAEEVVVLVTDVELVR